MRSLERQYRLLYRLGLTPWEAGPTPAALRELTEGPRPLVAGQALDLGCGTGRHASRLAALGWSVLAVDVSPVAIAHARERSSSVDWQLADIRGLTTLPALLRKAGSIDLVVDLGCLHGLDPAGRRAWADGVHLAAAPGAVAVIGALRPGRRPAMPRGISADDIATLLGPGWRRRPHTGETYVFARAGSWPTGRSPTDSGGTLS